MSQLLIRDYLNDLKRIQQTSGSLTEGVISEAFKDLLKGLSKQKGLVFINQYEFVSPQKNRIRPDGTILHDLRVPFGYWEAKDIPIYVSSTPWTTPMVLASEPATNMTFSAH